MKQSMIASEAEIITVAVRRVDLTNADDSFLTVINPSDYIFYPIHQVHVTPKKPSAVLRLPEQLHKTIL